MSFSPEFLSSVMALLTPELVISLLLLAVVILRRPVYPHVAIRIAASPAEVFKVIDVTDGKVKNYGRVSVTTDRDPNDEKLYRYSYKTLLTNGRLSVHQAHFRVVERVEGEKLVLAREGLEGASPTNQLLKMVHELKPTEQGTILHTTYHWGPRILLAQLIARADLLGGAYRIRGLVETGIPNDRPYQLISTALAAITAGASVIAFATILGLEIAALLVFALFVHEVGHLLAYRMAGQPWGRLMFLPFLGAIAIPKLPHETQAQVVFAALMGPGFSIILSVACYAALAFGVVPDDYVRSVLILGLASTGINIFNMIPVEPLDGGVALRSVLVRLSKRHMRAGLLAVGGAVILFGLYTNLLFLSLVGAVAFLFNMKTRKVDDGLLPLSYVEVASFTASYFVIFAVHAAIAYELLKSISLLMS